MKNELVEEELLQQLVNFARFFAGSSLRTARFNIYHEVFSILIFVEIRDFKQLLAWSFSIETNVEILFNFLEH
jgi:hypothetical protein